jgi:hypothetical protein
MSPRDRKFYDDGLGWENVYTGLDWNKEPCVVATLASGEDPLEPARLTAESAREFAAALIAAANRIDRPAPPT